MFSVNMAGKKLTRLFEKFNCQKLEPSEVLCPICRTILYEPVTLTCGHAFCKLCLESSMEMANLACPICRLRIASWYRRNKKNGKLIDEAFWRTIQHRFPVELRNKQQGIDNDIEKDQPIIIVAEQGAIRKEYEIERKKEQAERQKRREAEEKASEAILNQIRLDEEERKRREQNIRSDELIARQLSEEMNKPSTSKANGKKVTKSGPLDRYIETKSNQSRYQKGTSEPNTKHQGITPKRNNRRSAQTCSSQSLQFAEKSPAMTMDKAHLRLKSDLYANQTNKDIYMTLIKNKSDYGQGSSSTSETKSRDSDDVIEQEFKYHFKPIEPVKTTHVPPRLPMKVVPLCAPIGNVKLMRPPQVVGKLDISSSSAFARYIIPEQDGATHLPNDLSKIESLKRKVSTNPEIPTKMCKPNTAPINFHGFNSEELEISNQLRDSIQNLVSEFQDALFQHIYKQNMGKNLNTTKNESRVNIISVVCLHPDGSQSVENNRILNGAKTAVNAQITDSEYEPRLSPIINISHKKLPLPNGQPVNIEKSLNMVVSEYEKQPKADNSIQLVENRCEPISINSTSAKKSPKKILSLYDNVEVDIGFTPNVRLKDSPNNVPIKSELQNLKNSSANGLRRSSRKPTCDIEISMKKVISREGLFRKKRQEADDLLFARKLQAEFDRLQIPSITRGGTKRQITLDQMKTLQYG